MGKREGEGKEYKERRVNVSLANALFFDWRTFPSAFRKHFLQGNESVLSERQFIRMALAYPEGECFFRRSVLNGGNSEGYKADDPKDFFSHMLVEYVWNVESDHGAKACNSPAGYGHPRSGYKIVRGSWWDTDYGCWTQLNFNYGPNPGDIKRRIQHNLCTNGNRFRDHEKGGAAEVKPSLDLMIQLT